MFAGPTQSQQGSTGTPVPQFINPNVEHSEVSSYYQPLIPQMSGHHQNTPVPSSSFHTPISPGAPFGMGPRSIDSSESPTPEQVAAQGLMQLKKPHQ